MAVTLKDIAERTGVSPSVVSTVLSGRDNGTFVSDSTRQKVLQVAEMLNYTPVRSGRPRGSRRLRRQRTEEYVGVWDPEYTSYSAFYVQNLQTALRKYVEQNGAESEDDYGLRLLTAEDLPRLDALGIMGLILLTPTLLPREAAVASIPCVMIGEVDNAPRELIQVHGDDFLGGRHVADYLWGLGHRRIAFLAPAAHVRTTRLRFQGMQSSWMAHQSDPKLIMPAQTDAVKTLSERDQVRRSVLNLFGPEIPRQSQPTALVCYDEGIAAIAAQTLAEMERRVPAEVSLIAFNDTPRVAEHMIPSLTTLRYPVAQIAETVISQLYLLHDIDAPDEIEHHDIALAGELVIRSSCAPPPAL